MANVLQTDKQIAIIANLAEGSSLRSIERMTGVHRDTIMRLSVKVGQGCTALMDTTIQTLTQPTPGRTKRTIPTDLSVTLPFYTSLR